MKSVSTIFVLQKETNKVLAVSRRDDHNDFGLPGGKSDDNETPEETVIRELFEETGILVHKDDLIKIDESIYNNNVTHCYMTRNYDGQIRQEKDGGVVKWMPMWAFLNPINSFNDYNLMVVKKTKELNDLRGKITFKQNKMLLVIMAMFLFSCSEPLKRIETDNGEHYYISINNGITNRSYYEGEQIIYSGTYTINNDTIIIVDGEDTIVNSGFKYSPK